MAKVQFSQKQQPKKMIKAIKSGTIIRWADELCLVSCHARTDTPLIDLRDGSIYYANNEDHEFEVVDAYIVVKDNPGNYSIHAEEK